MGRFAKLPWHWWVATVLVFLASLSFALNLAFDWRSRWIEVGAPLVVLVTLAYNARVFWLLSDPQRSKDQS